jgi:small-conductance mechanosensitive channel
MIKSIRLIVLLSFLALISGGAMAQVAAPSGAPPVKSETQEDLDASVQRLSNDVADLQKRLDVSRPSNALLQDLGTQVSPLVTRAQALVDRLTPRVAAIKAPLDQFGPKPDKGETPEVTKERDTLQKAFDDNDGLLKRAKALVVLAQKVSSYIALRQRTLFTNSLFQRSTSILSPPLWTSVVKETPGNIGDATQVFKAWLDGLNQDLTGGKLFVFWALVVLVLLAYWPLTRAAKRFIQYDPKIDTPSEWQKALLACWTALSVSALMIAIMYAVVYVFSFFEPPDQRLMPFFSAMQWGVIRLALAAGLSRGLLSPGRPKWRLIDLDDTACEKLTRIVVGVALIVSGGKIIEALNDSIGASLEFSVASRGVCALLVAAALAVALIDLGDDPDADNATTASPSQRHDLYGVFRGLAWALIVVITVAVLIGYIPFGSFLTEQLTLVAATGTVLFLLIHLVDEACDAGLQPGSRLGRSLIYTVGLRRETLQQLPVLLSGAARLALILIALLVVAAPWGMQSSDVSGNLDAIFFGFRVGDVTVSLAGIAVAIASFVLVLGVTHAVQNWLEDRYLPTTRLDSGLRNSIKTSLGYTGFILAVALAAANLGVDFQKLAIVAGALSVGIGFGLQSIVNNFVSGLILLWERAVRVGDWVIVGSDQGYVRKINVRSTEIETFDRAAVIVPNSNLVSGVVKNLMRTDRIGRLTIDLTVHASADPEKVREVLLDIARENEGIVSLPSPQVRFTDLTATAMSFSLFCFVADVESMARTKSDLYFEICRQFRQNKFFDGPAPDPTRIDIEGLDRLEAILKSSRTSDDPPLRSRKTG